MPDPDYLRKSIVHGAAENSAAAKDWQRTTPLVDPGNYCAYNQTRGRFLSVEVEAGDFSGVSLDNRLATLLPKSGAAFWIVPFRGMSLTSARVPFDLLYLDLNSTVIDAVESFPISRPSDSTRPAASVLALPAESIAFSRTLPGDRIILCPPGEIMQRLRKSSNSGVPAQVDQSLSARQSAVSGTFASVRRGPAQVLQWDDRIQPKLPVEFSSLQVPPVVPSRPQEPSPATELSKPAQDIAKATKNWLQRWWDGGRPEPRNQPREVLHWISAYFFTGAAPVAFSVRNISPTGMFVYTNERWYLGTIVRMTLSDKREPTSERSITVNAMVVRWGNDGVGLNFIFQDGKKPRHGSHPAGDGQLVDVSEMQLKEFLRRGKSDMS